MRKCSNETVSRITFPTEHSEDDFVCCCHGNTKTTSNYRHQCSFKKFI